MESWKWSLLLVDKEETELKGYQLQLFNEAVSGKKIVYMYRILADAAKMDAVHLAFTTENSISISRDADTTETKDGPIRTPGAVEIEVTTTALLAQGDEMLDKLQKALINGDKVEVWKINLKEPGTGSDKFKAKYYQAYVTEFEEASNAEDYVECSLTFGIEGTGADGEVTLTGQQQEMIELYGFADIKKTEARNQTAEKNK